MYRPLKTGAQGFHLEKKGIAKCNRKPGRESQDPALWALGSGPNPLSRSNGNHKMPSTFGEALLLLRHQAALHLLPFRYCVIAS